LTNVTRVPGETVNVFGDTPVDVIVIVVPPPGDGVGEGVGDGVGAGVGLGLGDGEVGELPPPHAASVNASASVAPSAHRRCLATRRISSRY
jgi:hypothetical protein